VFVEALGWAAAVYSSFVMMPQLARVARSRTTAGISLLAWQCSLAGSLSWCSYGVMADYPNIWIPNVLLTVSASWMLIMICRDQRLPLRNRALAFVAPMVIAAATAAMAVVFGPLAFAAAAFLPAAVAQVMQLRSLMVSADISAVSLPYLVLGVVGQVLWFCWGMVADDISNKLVAGCLAVLVAANLTWCALRRFGLVWPQTTIAVAAADLPLAMPMDLSVEDDEDTLIHAWLDRSAELLESVEAGLAGLDAEHSESSLEPVASAA